MEDLNPRRRKVRSPDSETSEHVQGYQKLSHKKGGDTQKVAEVPPGYYDVDMDPPQVQVVEGGLPEDPLYPCRGGPKL